MTHHNADVVDRLQQTYRRRCSIVGQLYLLPPALVCGHRAGLVHNYHDRERRHHLGLADRHVHGEGLLDGRVVISSCTEAVLTADHGEAYAEILYGGLDHRHLIGGQIPRRNV